jgi:glycosyltransferase involved in cell wall biosynthesis
MRIAQVAPLYESVPPKCYGGTERIVSYLTEELVDQGHDVTLFASGDSVTRAYLEPACRCALRLDEECVDQLAHHILMLENVMQRSSEFDLIHFHVDYLHFPLSRRMRTPQVTTLHGRLTNRDIVPLHQEFRDMPVVSISMAQRKPLSWANWLATVYHGLPEDLYRMQDRPGDYLAFLGRISPERRVDRAIEIARRVGMPLKIAARVDHVDRDYFEGAIRPTLRGPLVEYVGEIADGEREEFLGGAHALLFPIDWPEPFGLIMIEAMACGTPVVAFRGGAVSEIVAHGETGFVVEDVEDAVEVIPRVAGLSRRRCRREFEKRFTAGRMARDYLKVYQKLIYSRRRCASGE